MMRPAEHASNSRHISAAVTGRDTNPGPDATTVLTGRRRSKHGGITGWLHGVRSASPDSGAGLAPRPDPICNQALHLTLNLERIRRWELAGEPMAHVGSGCALHSGSIAQQGGLLFRWLPASEHR